MKVRKQKLENKHITANDAKPVLAVVPKCSHFWKMVTKNYYKCAWCDERHYCQLENTRNHHVISNDMVIESNGLLIWDICKTSTFNCQTLN